MYNHIAFMTDCATRHKSIKHTEVEPRCHRISGIAHLEQFLDRITQLPEGIQLLAEEELTGKMLGDDNYLDDQYHSFYVVKDVLLNDHEAREQCKKDCKRIALAIVGRMKILATKANCMEGDPHSLRDFDPESVSYYSIGPLGTGYYGIGVSFTVKEPANKLYIADEWDEQ